MRVSVIVPTLNREEPLRRTLAYFLGVDAYPSFDIIVVDQSGEVKLRGSAVVSVE